MKNNQSSSKSNYIDIIFLVEKERVQRCLILLSILVHTCWLGIRSQRVLHLKYFISIWIIWIVVKFDDDPFLVGIYYFIYPIDMLKFILCTNLSFMKSMNFMYLLITLKNKVINFLLKFCIRYKKIIWTIKVIR